MTIIEAWGINDSGQIVGGGSFQGGPEHAVLLIPVPVPDPGSLELLATAASGWLLWRRRAALVAAKP